jgi:hypothetical protein
MTDFVENGTPTIDARLATLEERTKPKPKTFVDKIKDWASVLPFIVAVRSSFKLNLRAWKLLERTAKRRGSKLTTKEARAPAM